MTRNAFFSSILGFLGVAEAQQSITDWTVTPGPKMQQWETPGYYPPQWSKSLAKHLAPKPNQCPVCGTMAAKYKKLARLWEFKVTDEMCDPTKSTPDMVKHCENMKVDILPNARMTRCRICNAVFMQDAEK